MNKRIRPETCVITRFQVFFVTQIIRTIDAFFILTLIVMVYRIDKNILKRICVLRYNSFTRKELKVITLL